MIRKFFAFGVVLAGAAIAEEQTPLSLPDMHKLAELASPQFSPDSKTLVYSVSQHHLPSDSIVSDLYSIDYRSGRESRLTHTDTASEWSPQYSADGAKLFFLSDRGEDESTQVWSMPAAGGEAIQLSQWAQDIEDYALSPDGSKLAFISYASDANSDSSVADEEALTPIVSERLYFKEDGTGYLGEKRRQLFVRNLADGTVFSLGDTSRNSWLPTWSPDSSRIAYVAKTGPEPDRHLNFDVYIVDAVEGAKPRQLSRFTGIDADPENEVRPQWSPDGSKLAWLQGEQSKWIYYAPQQLVVADVQTGKLQKLAWQDRWMDDPQWSADGLSIFAIMEESRESHIVQLDLHSGSLSYLSAGPQYASEIAVAGNGRLVQLASEDKRPYELYALEGARRRPLSQHNAWLDSRKLFEAENFEFASDDVQVHGFFTRPANSMEEGGYPTVVQLHGGPVYQYSREFDFDRQLYAAKGYLVVSINPRGSSGRGFDFARAIYADWGNKDVKDILSGIDHLQARGLIDPQRIALAGWSYGGILTNYLIASDTRFRAAASGAGLGNVLGTFGHDMYIREYLYELGTPWDNPAVYQRLSFPFLHADRIKTPTLFQCTGADFNVPCIGSEQMYQALRVLNIPTRLVIYPEQPHHPELPSLLLDRLQRKLDWFERHMHKLQDAGAN